MASRSLKSERLHGARGSDLVSGQWRIAVQWYDLSFFNIGARICHINIWHQSGAVVTWLGKWRQKYMWN
jgi:hypothetical protein